ncbi:hypothetical protein B0H13DRAFT_2311331 [Mycena leptocephala]|nr:hypothetical protein B0H13DRAFT_2311331 [Mycena leptocephala]
MWPWTNTTSLSAPTKKLYASIINIEISRLVTHIRDEEAFLRQEEQRVREESGAALAHQVYRYQMKRGRSDDDHITRLTALTKLPGFTVYRRQTEGWEYRVKWAGYDSDEDSWVIDAQCIHMELRSTSSWEPTENVEACQALLRRFWNEIGLDDNDYGHGHVVMASKEWIELERRVFKEDFPPKKKYKREPKHRPDESGRETVTQTMGTSLQSHSDLAIPDLSSGSAYSHRLIHSLPTATIQARNQHRRSGPKFDEGKLLVVASSCRTNLFSFLDP